ncbi:uncharacterized protein LOC128553869 [Mercenaria mercenaria]|uniref:uncharacterized protein LOC128553869 n=1 Tax=Mercenaria mercenaria TaxID=6596 RepID=UPI00234E99B3|nr:uncharacterized protein LOC128553869 [Mercenaria mercenaria]
MEKIIRNAIVQHIENSDKLSNHQHGFRKGRSCTTQLLECIGDWTTAIDEKYDVDIIYLDFKAAFDKVPHKRLLKKIWSIGIRGNLYNWIKDFLDNRQQRVKVNGSISKWQKVTSGQVNCAFKLFADDTKLYSVMKSFDDEERLQDNIFNACEWASKWQMLFNAK